MVNTLKFLWGFDESVNFGVVSLSKVFPVCAVPFLFFTKKEESNEMGGPVIC